MKLALIGHRQLAGGENLDVCLKQVMAHIQETYQPVSFTILSNLAEGADRRLVDYILRQFPAHLVAVLPLPAQEYRRDFQSPASVDEFNRLLELAGQVLVIPAEASREQAYLRAGRYLLDNCDVLIALWDGKDPLGVGGTGQLVAEARHRGLPLAWIQTANLNGKASQPIEPRESQGPVTFERF